jgi:broad specificity phosphatase PhoE
MIKAVPIHPRSKIVHFVRHAEGEHNVVGEVNYEDYLREDLEDAVLSEHGVSQCKQLYGECIESGAVNDAELLVVSPMRRTLQTAVHSFPHLIGKIPWIAHELAREQTGLHPCDRRRPTSELKGEFAMVNFDLIEHEQDPYYYQFTEAREPDDVIISRGRQLLQWLGTRTERNIVVVTHSAYLRIVLTNVTNLGTDDDRHPHFRNCEMRSYAMNLLIDDKSD